MKIYLYDPDSGHYQGEDFADDSFMEKKAVPPAGATNVAPPSYGPGETAIFSAVTQGWEIRKISAVRD